MAILTIMIGISGSGKSTVAKKLAEQSGAKIVSTDGIRGEFGDETRQDINGLVFKIARTRVEFDLSKGQDVIVDATNVDVKSRAEFIEIGKSCKAEIRAVFVDTPMTRAKAQNNRRARNVPDHVIEKQSRRLVAPKVSEGFDVISVIA